MPLYTCGNCGRTDFDSFGELQDHDCNNWSDDDPDGGATPPLVADGGTRTAGSKYVHPTGPGYLGVYSVDRWSCEISVAAMSHIDWTTDTTVTARNDPSEPGLQIAADRDTEDIIAECKLENRGHGLLVYCHPTVIRELDGHTSGDDIRVYQYDDGLTIVPRDKDPFVSTGGDQRDA